MCEFEFFWIHQYRIDDATEIWYDRVDNDGDGEIDEQDEVGTSWTDRIGSTAGDYGLGEYEYTEDGRIIFDSNGDGYLMEKMISK